MIIIKIESHHNVHEAKQKKMMMRIMADPINSTHIDFFFEKNQHGISRHFFLLSVQAKKKREIIAIETDDFRHFFRYKMIVINIYLTHSIYEKKFINSMRIIMTIIIKSPIK